MMREGYGRRCTVDIQGLKTLLPARGRFQLSLAILAILTLQEAPQLWPRPTRSQDLIAPDPSNTVIILSDCCVKSTILAHGPFNCSIN